MSASSSTASSRREEPGSHLARLVLIAISLSALILSSVALWRASDTEDDGESEQTEVAEAADGPELSGNLARRPSAEREDRLQRRIDDLERKLSLVVAASEGRLSKTVARHDAERRKLRRDLALLHREVGSLAITMSAPIVPGAADAHGNFAHGVDAGAEEEEDEEDEGAPDAGVTEPAAEPEPGAQMVRRDELLQTLQDQSIHKGVQDFASLAGLDERQSAAVEQVVRSRGEAHSRVIAAVTANRLSVRDASLRLEKINADAQKSMRKTLNQEQLQRFQDTMSRLDFLLWHF